MISDSTCVNPALAKHDLCELLTADLEEGSGRRELW